MKVEFVRRAHDVELRMEGELDEHSAKGAREQIDEYIDSARDVRIVTFDMSKITFIDSTGLGFVLGRYRKLKEKGIELCISGVSAPVDKVFRTSGVYRYVPIIE